MRHTGTQAMGIRLPIIDKGDNLADIVVDCVIKAAEQENVNLKNTDVIGVTEAIVAKAEGNFATIDDIAYDIKEKFGSEEIGLVYPMLSRNRFLNILRGVAKGAEKVHLLLSYPNDEVGNPIMDSDMLDEVNDIIQGRLVTAKEFSEITGAYSHPFTGIDYLSLYGEVGDNVDIYMSNDPRDILQLTKNILVGEIHNRFKTKSRLLKAGAVKVYTLSDILSKSVNGNGYNEKYGILGSNLSTDDTLKLLPNRSEDFVKAVREKMYERTGVLVEALVYGDGAFKDPVCGIWELADPVVSPGYTEKLGGRPTEIKLKYVADKIFSNLTGDEKRKAVTEMIKNKNGSNYSEGTTPRKYADLLGSLCDLMSGSGDKGTPVVLIKAYFDDYATE